MYLCYQVFGLNVRIQQTLFIRPPAAVNPLAKYQSATLSPLRSRNANIGYYPKTVHQTISAESLKSSKRKASIPNTWFSTQLYPQLIGFIAYVSGFNLAYLTGV